MQYLLDKLNAFASWLFDLVTYALQFVWQTLMAALAAVLNAIPVPDFLTNAVNVIGAMPPGVAYVCAAFQVPAGITILVTAYTVRFVVRRIPLIG